MQLDVRKEFPSEDAAVPVSMLLGFLWDKPDIFVTFSEKFVPQFCNHLNAKKDILGLNSFLAFVVHRLFVDLTGQVQDWRVVNIQEKFVHKMV